MVISWVPSKLIVLIRLEFKNLVAVSALPFRLPETTNPVLYVNPFCNVEKPRTASSPAMVNSVLL